MTLPTITITGRLIADPELRFTAAGKAVVKLRLVADERKFNKATNEWEDGSKCFLDASAWEKLAESVTESLVKGDPVIATGKLVQREYETNAGEKRTVYEVRLDNIGPDLRSCTAKANRPERNQPTGRATVTDDPWQTAVEGNQDSVPF